MAGQEEEQRRIEKEIQRKKKEMEEMAERIRAKEREERKLLDIIRRELGS